MENSKKNTGNEKVRVQFVEVLIPAAVLKKHGDQLRWTLEVYSLENHPVNHEGGNGDAYFHFMVYDWKRTIRHMLTEIKAPYVLTGYFEVDSVLPMPEERFAPSFPDHDIVKEMNQRLMHADFRIADRKPGKTVADTDTRNFVLDETRG